MPDSFQIVALVALGLGVVALLPSIPFRYGWLACLAWFAWAGSSMPYAEQARLPAARFGFLLLVAVQGTLRLRAHPGAERPPAAGIWLMGLILASILWTEDRSYAALSAVLLFALGGIVLLHLPRLVRGPEDAFRLVGIATGVWILLIVVGLLPISGREEIFLGGRLRGFFSNPNGLGVACALLVPVHDAGGVRPRCRPSTGRVEGQERDAQPSALDEHGGPCPVEVAPAPDNRHAGLLDGLKGVDHRLRSCVARVVVRDRQHVEPPERDCSRRRGIGLERVHVRRGVRPAGQR